MKSNIVLMSFLIIFVIANCTLFTNDKDDNKIVYSGMRVRCLSREGQSLQGHIRKLISTNRRPSARTAKNPYHVLVLLTYNTGRRHPARAQGFCENHTPHPPYAINRYAPSTAFPMDTFS